MSPITLFCNFFHLERQPFRLFLAAANKEYCHNYNPNLASLRNPALPKADVVAYATAVLLGRNVNFLHFEGGGVGGAVGVLAQGLPLHDAILDGFNLPPLAVLLIAGALVLPAGAEQVAVHEVVGVVVVAYLPLAVHFVEVVE